MRTLRGAAAALLLAALSLAYAPPVAAQPPQTVTPQGILTLDAARSLKTLCGSLLPDGSLAPCHNVLDTTGARIDPATKQLQQQLISIMGTPLQANGHVNVDSSALPAGAATDASVLAVKAAIQAARTGDHVIVDNAPAGAATDASVQQVKAAIQATRIGDHVIVDNAPAGAATDASVLQVKAAVQAARTGDHVTVDAATLPTGAATDTSVQQVKAAVQAARTGDHVTVDAAPLPTGAATAAAQTAGNASLATIAAGLPAKGVVVEGDQSYNVGDNPLLNFTKTGRLKVGMSSATNIAPAAPATTTTASDLFACVYRATPPTWLDGWTGAVSCDATGNVNVTLASSGTPGAGAPAKVVQMGGTDGTNLRALKTTANGNLIIGAIQEGFQLVTANTAAAAQTLYGGDYLFSQTCSAYGTENLQVRGPDGATFITIVSKTAADTSAGTGFTFGAGAVVQVALSGTTGCNATLTRVP